jgi:hypothetical protein
VNEPMIAGKIVERIIEAMLDSPFIDDEWLTGTSQQRMRCAHYAGIALPTMLATIEQQAATITSLTAEVEKRAWQPIETAPIDKVVDWWIASDGDKGGWRKTGYRLNDHDCLCVIEEDGRPYWPHENGGWPTHWMPQPEPPQSNLPIRSE